MSPARTDFVHRGKNVGGGRLKAALKRGTKGRYLEVLLGDFGPVFARHATDMKREAERAPH